MDLPTHGHDPVMVDEVLAHLSLQKNNIVLDCTAGRGGHAEALLRQLASLGGGTLIGLDVDPENLKYAKARIEALLPTLPAPVTARWFHANFGEAGDVLDGLSLPGVHALLADFGVSTNQLLDTKHGLSFNAEALLDMRLDPRIKQKASDLIKELSEKQLADIFYEYAQERCAYRIARKIVQTRTTEPIQTTGQLARLVRSVVPQKWGQIDPATRTFQALRMAVNEELSVINNLLDTVPNLLNPGGKAAFISFHSGEDRLVKQATKRWQTEGLCEILTHKPVEPSSAEMDRNPRSRSAKLRAVQFARTDAGKPNKRSFS